VKGPFEDIVQIFERFGGHRKPGGVKVEVSDKAALHAIIFVCLVLFGMVEDARVYTHLLGGCFRSGCRAFDKVVPELVGSFGAREKARDTDNCDFFHYVSFAFSVSEGSHSAAQIFSQTSLRGIYLVTVVGINGRAEDHAESMALPSAPVKKPGQGAMCRKDGIGANNAHWHKRYFGFEGQPGGASPKRTELTGSGSGAFGVNQQGATVGQDFCAGSKCGQDVSVAVGGNGAGQPGNQPGTEAFKVFPLGKTAERTPEGRSQAGGDQKDVEVGLVVRAENKGALCGDVFPAVDFEFPQAT
jgi:hypothetical protein